MSDEEIFSPEVFELGKRPEELDGDLPSEDRSSRKDLLQDHALAIGDKVSLTDGRRVVVIGPGRGRNVVLCAYKEADETADSGFITHIGSFTSAQIAWGDST